MAHGNVPYELEGIVKKRSREKKKNFMLDSPVVHMHA
jgi:hypothetical protein